MTEELDFSQGKQGAIAPTPSSKTAITTMLDNDILEWFHNQVYLTGGGKYQVLINKILHEYIQHSKELSEVKEKTSKELDDIFKLLEKIAPTAASTTRRLSLRKRDMEAPGKWEKIAFIGLISSASIFIVSIILLRFFKTIPYALFLILCMTVFTCFLIWFALLPIIKEWRKNNTKQRYIKNFEQDAEYENRLIDEIIKATSSSTLKIAKINFEFSIKLLQTRHQTTSSWLPLIVGLVGIIWIELFYGGQQLLGSNSLDSAFNILKAISVIATPMLPIANIFDKSATESVTNEYNRCLYLLDKAQVLANHTENSKNFVQAEQHE